MRIAIWLIMACVLSGGSDKMSKPMIEVPMWGLMIVSFVICMALDAKEFWNMFK